ncbi:MAG TPA: NADH-quinone oxidoreductase subunit L, partial [Geobacteraceae bacterium]
PLTGGFFSKDGILAAVWLKGGALYGGLYLLGIATAFLTALYTFRLLYLVFAGDGPTPHRVAPLMEAILVPLALLGLLGGGLNLPAFLGAGMLDRFLASPGAGHAAPLAATELALEGVAALACLGGFLLARHRYGEARRAERLAAAEAPSILSRFLLNGWYVDDLYRRLFIRPYERLARLLWERVDEGAIDGSLDRLADLLGRSGVRLGRWSTGRVSVYLLSFAAGAALILGYMAWWAWRTS